MNTLSKILAATALTFSIAAPALAAGEHSLLEERNVYLFMNGKMVSAKATDATHALAMKEFTPIKNGTMIYVSGGKYYIATDKKLATGQMLQTVMIGKDLSIASEH